MQPRGVSSVSQCVDDEVLFSLSRGELAPNELAQVEAHLRDCADCRAVLGEAARNLEPRALDSEGPASIARYQIRSLIGAGAAGVVYRAFDPDLQRTVAIKVLRPDLHGTAPGLSARMLREAQAMARLSDPHVVAVYDVGIQDGAVYLVMEHVAGPTLSQWLNDAPRSTTQILKVFCDAGRGLLAAHQKGLVHLDFKPENVLVTTDGRALVTDFGLAREADRRFVHTGLDANDPAELYSPTRGLVGTPAYMAPELFEGGSATASSDQFAFCVALFTAVFERHPFGAGLGITLEELVARARENRLDAPASLPTDQRARVLSILRRGLAADPAQRYTDLSFLLTALEPALRDTRRTKLWIAALASALLVAAMATGLYLRRATLEPSADSERRKSVHAQPTEVASVPQPADSRPSEAAPITPSAQPDPVKADATKEGESNAAANGQVRAVKRRTPRKKAEVRYRDWLKDPF